LTLSEFYKDINGLPMTVLFTPEDLVRYLYNETSPETTAAIEAALQEDWTLREKFEVLKASSQTLDKALESPRTEVILNVLNYAREAATQPV
jgi:anti-sigma factor RsiW